MEELSSIEILWNIQSAHYQEHQEKKSIFNERDYSCRICYPPPVRISKKFEKFITWCNAQFDVKAYSWKTVEMFEEYITQDNLESVNAREKLEIIVRSFTFKEVPHYTPSVIRNLIELATRLSIGFTEYLEVLAEELKKYYKSRFGDSPPESSPKEEMSEGRISPEIVENDLETYRKEMEGKEDEYNEEEFLDEEYMKRFGKSIKGEDKTLDTGDSSKTTTPEHITSDEESDPSRAPTPEFIEMTKIVKYTTFSGKEEEDPTEWLEKFERAATANSLEDDHRLAACIGLLQDEAAEWYQRNTLTAGMNLYTHDANPCFKKLLINEFTSESKKTKYTQELFGIKQQFGETVDQYATRFRRMVKYSGQTIDNGMKKLLFLNGINPQHGYMIRAQNPTTIEDIIKIAKQLEIGSQPFMNQQLQSSVSSSNPVGFGGFQPFPLMPQQQLVQQTATIPGFPNVENVEKKDNAVTKKDIDDITDRLQKMSIDFLNVERNQQRRPVYNYNQRNNQNFNRPNVTCYNCGMNGHLSRNCRNQFRNQSNQPVIRNDNCFVCNQPGHIARECPNNNRIQPQQQSSNNSNNNIGGTSTRKVNNLRFRSLN